MSTPRLPRLSECSRAPSHNVRHGLQVPMDVHRPGRTRRKYSMMEAPQGADGRRPVCRPWPTGQVPPDQEASAGINQNLGVAKYLQGRLIDRQQPNRFSETSSARRALDVMVRLHNCVTPGNRYPVGGGLDFGVSERRVDAMRPPPSGGGLIGFDMWQTTGPGLPRWVQSSSAARQSCVVHCQSEWSRSLSAYRDR